MIAKDLMSAPVVSIGPDTPVADIAALLTQHHISGVPVVEQGRVVGIVNEMDLLHRYEIGTERASTDPGWWARLFGPDRAPSDYVKSHAVRAQDVMNRTIVSVAEDTPLATIASLFDARTVRRVCVVRNDELTGVITRADLVRAVAAKARSAPEVQPGSDEAIRAQLLAELQRQRWWWPDWSGVTVEDGVVTFLGIVRTEDERAAARVAAENVAGVRRVDDRRQRLDELPLGL